jgi:deoxyribonuclease V
MLFAAAPYYQYKHMINYDNIKVPEATAIQKELRNKVVIQDKNIQIHTVGGADISLNMFSKTIYAGIVLLSFPQLKPIGYSLVKSETNFPYVPGYLAFREVPALVQVWEQMKKKPDILVVDGHGIAHPRRLGIAAHFGALTGQPSTGCAKKILFGKFEEPGMEKGAYSPIYDKGEEIGYVLRSKAKVKPVYVSPGHLISLADSLQLMKECLGSYRIPEPTRLAHELVNKFRTGELQEGYFEL